MARSMSGSTLVREDDELRRVLTDGSVLDEGER
jgi:hypothetical protein